jgi:hypothetical protein
MNPTKALSGHRELCDLELSKRAARAHDYSDDDDILSNPKVIAALISVLDHYGLAPDIGTPWGGMLYMLLHKLVRILNLVANRDSAYGEPIGDSVLDLRVYARLFQECYMEVFPADKGNDD